jgi:hypothetical protein
MKITKEIRRVGDGTPLLGAQVVVQTWPGLVSIGSGEADADGLATITGQGSPGQIRSRSSRGGFIYDEFSGNMQPAGAFDLENLQTRVGALVADGILGDYGSRFRISSGSGSVTVASGGVVLDGILALFPSPTTIAVTDGDRAIVAYVEDGAVGLVEQEYSGIVAGLHVPIYRYTVTSGNVVTSSITDIGRLAGPRAGRKSQIGISRLASGSTTNAVGEASGLSTTLTLEAGTYDIRARVSAIGNGRDGALGLDLGAGVGTYRSLGGDISGKLTNADVRSGVSGPGSVVVQAYERSDTALVSSGWTLLDTYDPDILGDELGVSYQVAVAPTGRVYVADTTNNRLVILDSDGEFISSISGLTGIRGVAADPVSADYAYVLYDGGTDMRLRSYNTTPLVPVLSWTIDFGSNDDFGNITTDGTTIWCVNRTSNRIYTRLCSNGTAAGIDINYGGGTGNGQFGASGPFSVAHDWTYVYVSDPDNNRVQRFVMATGVYNAKWTPDPGTGYGPAGLAIDSLGQVLVTYEADAVVSRYTNAGVFVDSFDQVFPLGIGIGSDDVVWVSTTLGQIAKWEDVSGPLPFEYQAALLTAIAIPR